jgi:hypothetical protein
VGERPDLVRATEAALSICETIGAIDGRGRPAAKRKALAEARAASRLQLLAMLNLLEPGWELCKPERRGRRAMSTDKEWPSSGLLPTALAVRVEQLLDQQAWIDQQLLEAPPMSAERWEGLMRKYTFWIGSGR